MTGLLTLASGEARVDIAPAVGGAVASFRWRGIDVLRPTPAAAVAEGNVRAFASFPLVPFSNRIAEGLLDFDGERHELDRNDLAHVHAIHGLGFQRPWAVASTGRERATLALDYAPAGDPLRAWPFAFRARQSFDLAERAGVAALTMSLAIESADPRPFPFGLGWHPYFPRTAATVLGFRAEGMWETGPTLLPTRLASVPAHAAFDPPRPIGDTALDNVFTGIDGAARLEDAQRGLRVSVEGDTATGFLVVFIPPGRDHLALEPVTHMTDAFNRHARGEAGTGTRTLRPGASFCCTMRVVAQSLGGSAA